jgi:hypothetical protein
VGDLRETLPVKQAKGTRLKAKGEKKEKGSERDLLSDPFLNPFNLSP